MASGGIAGLEKLHLSNMAVVRILHMSFFSKILIIQLMEEILRDMENLP